jgi:hypothetical protein
MGSDPQSYLQYQYERDRDEACGDIRRRLPFAVFSGREKYEYGAKRIAALCESQAQAEALIRNMWPTSGYWELGWTMRQL